MHELVEKVWKIWDYLTMKILLLTSAEFFEIVVYGIFSTHKRVYIHI